MAEYALRLANSQDTAERVRKGDALGLTPGGIFLARAGLRPDGGGAVAVVNGTMSVSVAAFAGWVDGGVSDAQGGYPFFLDAGKTLAIAAGHASLVRIDTVVAQVRDTAYDGSGFTDARVYIVQGTPGAGAPAVPQSAIPLRDISVHAGASSGTGGLTAANLSTDRRQYFVGLGGTLPVASQAERDALVLPQKGATVYRGDTDRVQVYNGTSWQTYLPQSALPVIQYGSTVTGTGTTLAVNFPVAFAGTPTVMVNPSTTNSLSLAVSSSAPSTTGFTLNIARASGSTSFTFNWTAIYVP